MRLTVEETGLEVLDLRADPAFAARTSDARDIHKQMEGLQRLSRALLEKPETILEELVQTAVDLCGADSAGISIETDDGDEQSFYRWVATAGTYSGFLGAILPRHPSACGVCLERNHPQHFTVTKKFFDILGVEAPVVTDGLLFPWRAEGTQGTIFVMAHDRTQAFHEDDVRLMTMLADFAAMGYRQQKQQKLRITQERATAAAQMANELAHKINNPLQSMTNVVYLMTEGCAGPDPKALGQDLANDLSRLSSLVKELLSLPLNPASGIRSNSPANDLPVS